ncbi:MAG TPA: LamG domain-containing protein [Kiritimatiellia bacterium]|nr:LamG domain-containing protein [Kiritimatiellia bacterium]
MNAFVSFVVVLMGLLVGACAEAPREVSASVSRVEELTGGRTRVVWVQDTTDRTDVFARGNRLRLMGYDSRDGAGERVLLAGPGSFSKPLITRRGDRVVFSDVAHERVDVVDWDGRNRRSLGPGYGLAVWIDPEDGTEWVYVARDPRDEAGQRFARIERRRIDKPETSEPVWDRSLVGPDSFQLSADGTRASGVFPWPECGVVRLDAQIVQRYGRGCWTSYSPDNSYRFWYFDGAHRNLTLIHERTQQRTTVAVNTLPDRPGFEVYHPRWSNHPGYFALTGPYTIRSGGNNIRGGGPDVEVYLGRFNEEFTGVDLWVKVTENPYLNIYPDVWIDPGEVPFPEWTADEVAGGGMGSEVKWPVTREGLVFLWQNRGGPNEITDDAGRRVRESRAEPFGRARYGRFLDMDVREDGFVATGVAEPLLEGLGERVALSVELVITPESVSSGTGVIMAYGDRRESRHVALLESGGELVVWWRGAEHPDAVATLPVARLEEGVPNHVVVAIEPGQLLVFLDGREVLSLAVPSLDVSSWTSEPMVFGANGDGTDNWAGHLEGIAIYHRALTAAEVWEKSRVYAEMLTGRLRPRTFQVRARVVEMSHIPTPEDIAPYRRALVVNEYEVLEGDLGPDNLLVAHWVILDGEVLATAERGLGSVHEMTLEFFDDRPELEGERLAIDSDNLLLETFFDVGR